MNGVLFCVADARHVVSKVTQGGPGDGALIVGDELLMVNGMDTSSCTHTQLIELLCTLTSARILLRRPTNSDGSWPVNATLQQSSQGGLELVQTDPKTDAVTIKPYSQHQRSVGRATALSVSLKVVSVDLDRPDTNSSFGFSMGTTGLFHLSLPAFGSILCRVLFM